MRQVVQMQKWIENHNLSDDALVILILQIL